jgi:hypothetical protein
MSRVYGFDESGIRNIREAYWRVKKTPRTGAQQRRIQPVLGGGGVVLCEITATKDDDGETPIPIWRSRFPEGFDAVRLADEAEVTLHADYVRSVYFTNEIVRCETIGGKLQIRDSGMTQWTGTAVTDITGEFGGDVLLDLGSQRPPGTPEMVDTEVQCYLYDTQDSVSEGSQCLVLWIDSEQGLTGLSGFRAIPVACPAQSIEEV